MPSGVQPLPESTVEAKVWEAVAEVELQGSSHARRLLRRVLTVGFILLITLAALGYGSYWLLVGRYLETTDDAYLQADSAVISPKVGGYLSEVAVGDNEPVSTGQTLARIDDRDYRAALSTSEAEVAIATAQVRGFDAQIDQQSSKLSQTDAQIASATALADYSRQDLDRSENLVRSGAISRQKEQSAQSDLKRSNAALAEARAMRATAQKQVEVLQAQRDQALGSLRRAEAMRDQDRLRLSYTVVTSPANGMVGDRSARVGLYVQPGTRLMTIVPVHDVYLIANFKETQLRDIARGQRVKIALDTDPDLDVQGTVESLAPGTGAQFALLPPENATGNFTKIVQRVPVKILIDPQSLKGRVLRPGLSVTATIDTRTQVAGDAATPLRAVGPP